mgnify:FL=1
MVLLIVAPQTKSLPVARQAFCWKLIPPSGRGSTAEFPLLDRCAGNERNVGALDAHVREFAVGQAMQFANRFTVPAPVVVGTHEVHGFTPFFVESALALMMQS